MGDRDKTWGIQGLLGNHKHLFSVDQKKEEYRDAIALLKKSYAIRDVAKLTGKGISTIQRVKKEFC